MLPKLRGRVGKDLSLPGLLRAKVMATIVRLLETTFVRIGNDEYARENQSFGLTMLRNKHVKVTGSKIRFRFRGKSGIVRDVDLNDRRLAQIVPRCQDLPGQELFQYLDGDGRRGTVNSSDVNESTCERRQGSILPPRTFVPGQVPCWRLALWVS